MKRSSLLLIPLVILISLLTAAYILTLRVFQSSLDIYAQEQVRLKVDNTISILSTYILNLYKRQTESIIRWYDWNAMLLNLTTPDKKRELFQHVHRAVVWGIPEEDYNTIRRITSEVTFLIPPPYIEGIIPQMQKTIKDIQRTSNLYVEVRIHLYNYTSDEMITVSITDPILSTLDPAEIIVFPLTKGELLNLEHGPGPGWYTRFGYSDPYSKDVDYTKSTFYVCYPSTTIIVRGSGGGITYERRHRVAEGCVPYDIGIYKQAETE